MQNLLEVRQRVMEALEEVISQQGIQQVSVRLIAQKTGLPKPLLYRYFGDGQQLLTDYVRQSQSFPHFTMSPEQEQLSRLRSKDAIQLCSSQLIQYFRQLRASKASREVIQASLLGDESLTEALGQTQHQEAMDLVKRLSLLEHTDSAATLAILLGGLYYLTLMAHHNRPMLRIDLRSETGWLRIEQALDRILRTVDQRVSDKRSQTSLAALAERGPADRGQTES